MSPRRPNNLDPKQGDAVRMPLALTGNCTERVQLTGTPYPLCGLPVVQRDCFVLARSEMPQC